tara:strand:- start:88 stop:267 length:180 start_codon:yes stop_codon:yes gene_type:complete
MNNNQPKRAMNIRGLDAKLYNDFKSAVYASGFKNIRETITSLMRAFVYKYEEHKTKRNQ